HAASLTPVSYTAGRGSSLEYLSESAGCLQCSDTEREVLTLYWRSSEEQQRKSRDGAQRHSVLLQSDPAHCYWRKATQRGERTQAGHPDPHNDLYTTLDLKSRSPDYDTLKTVRDAAKPSSSSQNHSTFKEYENIQERRSAERKT
ncbi:hypothetical protein JZ751_007464, partial [Albula glossodonta]